MDYELNVPQIEIMIWFNLCQKWSEESYRVVTRLLGANWDEFIQFKRFQEELKKIDYRLKDYLFWSNKSIRPELLKYYLGKKSYSKPVLLVIVNKGGKFGTAFHATLALINKLNEG